LIVEKTIEKEFMAASDPRSLSKTGKGMAADADGQSQDRDGSRSANERLQDVAGRTAEDGTVVPLLCECAADDCMGRVEITIDDYSIAHFDADHYVVMPGHRLRARRWSTTMGTTRS
jgi:hypothetical protein